MHKLMIYRACFLQDAHTVMMKGKTIPEVVRLVLESECRHATSGSTHNQHERQVVWLLIAALTEAYGSDEWRRLGLLTGENILRNFDAHDGTFAQHMANLGVIAATRMAEPADSTNQHPSMQLATSLTSYVTFGLIHTLALGTAKQRDDDARDISSVTKHEGAEDFLLSLCWKDEK